MRGFLSNLFGTPTPVPDNGSAAGPEREDGTQTIPTLLVDAATRTFWTRGALATATLVEAPAPDPAAEAPRSRRLSEVVHGDVAALSGSAAQARPRGNPAFAEGVFVELMRARRFDRAFGLLPEECQRRWRSVSAFAAAHKTSGLGALRGAKVKEVRYREHWQDPASGTVHRLVAELDVEYTFLGRGLPSVLEKTVHLAAVEGKWRPLCFPPHTGS